MGQFDSHFGLGRFHPRHFYPYFRFLFPQQAVLETEAAPAFKYAGLRESPYEPGRFYPAYFYQSFHGRPPLIQAPRLPAPAPIPLTYPDVFFRPSFEAVPPITPIPHVPHVHHPRLPDDPYGVDQPVPYPPIPMHPRPQQPPTQPSAPQHGYNRDAIAAALKGALSGRVDSVINIALRHGLNPAFFAAVIMKESNGGSSRAATDGRNNFTGISGSGRPKHLGSTAEEGLEKGAALLARYLQRHGTTIAAIPAIARIYAPVGASNDPHGTNGTWPSGVLSFFRRFGGQQALNATGATPHHVAQAPSAPDRRGPQPMPQGFRPAPAQWEWTENGPEPSFPSARYDVRDMTRSHSLSRHRMDTIRGFIVHHTAGGGTPESVIRDWQNRGGRLSTQFIIDRSGRIHQLHPDGYGGSHIQNGWGRGAGLNNRNVEGVEIIARNDGDVTPAQARAAIWLIAQRANRWGFDPVRNVYGHGEVNPGHRQADEGKRVFDMLRGPQGRELLAQSGYGSGTYDTTRFAGQRVPETRSPDFDTVVSEMGQAPPHYAGMEGQRRGRRQTAEPLSALSRMARGPMAGLAQRMLRQNVFQNVGRGFEQAENIQTEQSPLEGFQSGLLGSLTGHDQRRMGRGMGALLPMAGIAQHGMTNPFSRKRKGLMGLGMDDMGLMG